MQENLFTRGKFLIIGLNSSRYGDELKLSTYVASLCTIMQKLMLKKTEHEDKSVVRMIESNKSKTVILFRQQVILMVVSRDKNDSHLFLSNILEHLNIQVLAHFSSNNGLDYLHYYQHDQQCPPKKRRFRSQTYDGRYFKYLGNSY